MILDQLAENVEDPDSSEQHNQDKKNIDSKYIKSKNDAQAIKKKKKGAFQSQNQLQNFN